jgi:hypothetical protein
MADPLVLLPTCGFAIQRLVEICDALRQRLRRAEGIVMLISVVCAALVIWLGGENFLILKYLGFDKNTRALDYAVTTLVMSAGTEGVNSIMKFLGNKKDETWAKVRALAGPQPSDGTRIRLL